MLIALKPNISTVDESGFCISSILHFTIFEYIMSFIQNVPPHPHHVICFAVVTVVTANQTKRFYFRIMPHIKLKFFWRERDYF